MVVQIHLPATVLIKVYSPTWGLSLGIYTKPVSLFCQTYVRVRDDPSQATGKTSQSIGVIYKTTHE